MIRYRIKIVELPALPDPADCLPERIVYQQTFAHLDVARVVIVANQSEPIPEFP